MDLKLKTAKKLTRRMSTINKEKDLAGRIELFQDKAKKRNANLPQMNEVLNMAKQITRKSIVF